MPGDPLRERDSLVQSLASMMKQGEAGLSHVPKLIVRIVETDAWRERVTALGEHVQWRRFEEFVTGPPLAGLGASVQLLRDMCRGEMAALDAIDRVTRNPNGVHAFDNIQGTPAPTGTSRQQALRRLRDQRPDLHASVLAGELSAHRAMVTAGFRKQKTALQQLAHWWQKATPTEQQEFLDWVTAQRVTARTA